MTACKDSLNGKKAVSATLAGVLAVGMVPTAAFAAEAPADEAQNDGIELLTADDVAAFNNGTVSEYKIDNGNPTAVSTTAISINGDGESHTVVPTKVKLAAKNGANDIIVDVTDTAKYKVTYKAQGSDGKPTGDEIAAPSDAGKYVAIVTAVAGDYKGASCYVGFEITAVSLSGAVAYEVNPEDAEDVTDTTFIYTGSELNVGFKLGDKALVEGTDYTVKFVPANGDVYGAATTVKDAGTYNYVLTGLGKYAGQTLGTTSTDMRQIKVDAFNLADAQIEDIDVVKGSAAPAHPTKVTVTSGDGKTTELDPSLVKLVRSNQTPFGASGNTAYDFTASAADGVNPVGGPVNVSGEKPVTVNQVAAIATFGYDGEAWKDSFSTNLSDKHPVYFNSDWIDVYGADSKKIDADKYTVTYQKKNSDGKEQLLNGNIDVAGTYKVTVEVNKNATDYALGGSATCEVVVSAGTVNADANVYVTYGGKVVTSVEKTYDKQPVKASDFTITAKDSKGNPIASGEIKADLYDANGKKVDADDGAADAGEYTLKLTSESYELTGTTEIPVTINKVDLSKLKMGAMRTWSGADYLPIKHDGVNNAATAYLWSELKLSYDTGRTDDDGDAIWAALSSTPDTLQSDTYLKAEKYDSEKGEWVEVSYADGLCKTAGDWRVTLTGNKTLAKNYEFANDDYTTTVEFKVVDDTNSEKWFTDVTPNDWFFNEVNAAHDAHYIYGVGNSSQFAPNTAITRADVCVILGRMAGVPTDPNAEGYEFFLGGYTTPFGDVDSAQYYAKAVAWAAKAGIVTGYGDTGEFKPEQAITREEFATMLARYAEKVKGADISADADALDGYADEANVSDWAKGYVAWAVEAKAMGQKTDMLWAGNDISRAEVAAMAVRYQPSK